MGNRTNQAVMAMWSAGCECKSLFNTVETADLGRLSRSSYQNVSLTIIEHC